MRRVQKSAKCHAAKVALIYRGIIDNLSDHLPSLSRKAKGKWTKAFQQMPDIHRYLHQQMGFFLHYFYLREAMSKAYSYLFSDILFISS